jgi:hypothetical protein
VPELRKLARRVPRFMCRPLKVHRDGTFPRFVTRTSETSTPGPEIRVQALERIRPIYCCFYLKKRCQSFLCISNAFLKKAKKAHSALHFLHNAHFRYQIHACIRARIHTHTAQHMHTSINVSASTARCPRPRAVYMYVCMYVYTSHAYVHICECFYGTLP